MAFRFGGEETGVMLLVLRKSTWKAIADYTLQPVLCQYSVLYAFEKAKDSTDRSSILPRDAQSYAAVNST